MRAFRPSDIPEVAALYKRAYLKQNDPPAQKLCDYFERVFFSDPWMGIAVSPSLVFVDDDGHIRGFIGAHPRKFTCGNEKITAVMMGQLMVDPLRRRRRIAWKLGSTLLAGPQTLTYGTTASPPAANMWRRLGFWNPPFAGLKWRIDPRAYRSSWRLGRLKSALQTVIRLAKFCTGRGVIGRTPNSTAQSNPSRDPEDDQGGSLKGAGTWHLAPTMPCFTPRHSLQNATLHCTSKTSDSALSCRPMDGPNELCALHESLLDTYPMRPDPDPRHAMWLWKMLSDSRKRGRMSSCVMVDSNDHPAGWALYTLDECRTAHTLELAYAPGRCAEVLAAYIGHLVKRGCVRVRGNCTTPEVTSGTVSLGAHLSVVESGCVFHCKDARVQSAILNGQAFFSELDSESWLDFSGR